MYVPVSVHERTHNTGWNPRVYFPLSILETHIFFLIKSKTPPHCVHQKHTYLYFFFFLPLSGLFLQRTRMHNNSWLLTCFVVLLSLALNYNNNHHQHWLWYIHTIIQWLLHTLWYIITVTVTAPSEDMIHPFKKKLLTLDPIYSHARHFLQNSLSGTF